MKGKIKVRLTIMVIIALLANINVSAQDKVVDQIVAIVGGNIILKSDIESMNIEQQSMGITSEGDAKCEILENFMIDKLLIAEAELDTLIEVTPSEVNQYADQQLQSAISHLGSEKAVENYYKKTIVEVRADFQENIQNQLLSQKMHNKIIADVEVTPSEVRYFYRSLSKDELPTIPTQYEYQQITIQPKIDIEEENKIKAELRDLKTKIENGSSSFTAVAIMESEDGSAKDGGVIGEKARMELDPAYAAAAFNLKGDKISSVVKSQFGYHIIQLVERRGEKVNTRHILKKPKISIEAKEKAYNALDSLAIMLRNNEIKFEEAAVYSSDINSRNNGGYVINPNTMSSKFAAEELDPDVSKLITDMEINEISKPFETIDPESQQTVYKIIKLSKKVDSHKANLQEDYQQLADAFLEKKREQVFQDWIAEKQKETYIRIDPTYANCNFRYSNWIK